MMCCLTILSDEATARLADERADSSRARCRCSPLLDRLYAVEQALDVARHPPLVENAVAGLLREQPHPAQAPELAAVP